MFKSRNSLLVVLFALLVLCLAVVEAAPQPGNNGNGNGNGNGNANGNSNGNGNIGNSNTGNANGNGNNNRGNNRNGNGNGNANTGNANTGNANTGNANGNNGNGNNNGNANGNGNGNGNNQRGKKGNGKTGNGQTGNTQTGNGNGNGNGNTRKKITTATDGSTILDMQVQINGLPIRFKVSAPADQFTQASGVQGAQAAANSAGSIGMNVLLHGDGGQSFKDFPNQGVNSNLMGVAVLSPDAKDRKWGGANRNGVERPDGAEHSQAVNDLIQNELPKVVAFNQSNVFFTGVSGGSLTLAGFFMPAFLGNYPNAGVLLSCGGLPPKVDFTQQSLAALANTRIHIQSTQKELSSLQKDIPQTVQAYEQAARSAGLSDDQINALQTVDNTPNGGHCAFDGQDFVSGVQTMSNSFGNIMLAGGNGQLDGTGNVLKGVVGNENLRFARGQN
ncbi:Cyclin-like F-box [Cordyceps javanica]|uniref:Cyclin-like F-box n=1 Tax=Cordyceps javanica TaxID=43265 RepID=A0A545UY27_9HYPO|nr:Cyclin-like F-box [Cordyceps javanica]TQW06221.1 Cyclin-like F-box [Cordyceps javanica]